MKISNKVRAEAIEFAGCMATYVANGDAPYPRTDSASPFSEGAEWLAFAARNRATANGIHEDRWAEAQAMLLDGWMP